MSQRAAGAPLAVAPARQRFALSSLERAQARFAWLLLIPTMVVVALVAVIPLVQTIWMSFTDARLGGLQPPRFVGLRNYVDLFQDYLFWQSVGVTVSFTVITVAAEFVLGMIVAL
ncbi:MAG TPA: sugar ABC transporter permease, partial [Chloroflexota bacterium]|nr:sugar ABC transporter permease [Chloroflexota bacterium]